LTAPGAALELSGLVKRYGDDVAVGGVSIKIKPGEFVTLLGPSGSGKTTTLNMIAGFVDVTEGDIHMDGQPIASVRPHKRNIGMIFQSYALFPHMTAAANVAYPLKQRKVPKRELAERVDQALELVGLHGLGKRYPRQLSGGQQQRVAFARAIVFSPRVLLMDEPLGALDRRLRETLQVEIKRIHRELGITFIYVTHDQEEALALSDRIAVFNEGCIEQCGTPTELYEHPETLFVAEFVGESNLFPGRLTTDGSAAIECQDGTFAAPAQDGIRAGDAVLLLRPHKLTLLAAGGGVTDNSLPGTVVETVYLGTSTKVVVKLHSGRRLIIRARAETAVALAVGDRVDVGWNAGDGVLLPAGPGLAESSAAELVDTVTQ
jgi:putative spermidine/putrescine transport system ATP-binding protein